MKRIPEEMVMGADEEAAAYREADFSEVNQDFAERLVSLLPEGPLLAVDLGCGPADIPRRVWLLRPDIVISAVDASCAMLALAAGIVAEAEGAITLVESDARFTPFEESSFDVVFSNSIEHHVDDPVTLWLEKKRIVKPGGLVFARDLARPDSEETARAIVERESGGESETLKRQFLDSLLAAWTPEEVNRQLDEAGLSGASVEKITDRHWEAVWRAVD